MAKIKIAQNPTFAAEVKIPRVGSEPVPVGFTFRYMDRTALAKLYDGWNQAFEAHAEKCKAEGASLEQFTAGQVRLQAEQIKAVTADWGFDDKFTDEAILDLVTTCVGAPQAVLNAYQEAYNPARLGN
ncbi:phage tail assembly chaperone [Pseudomonas auratipiscis]|uniref:Phage tail assembly chaperone n=1 Tax=Pseudomonas auratipiscis TaxID=3115853 RepID=A0AB35WZS6_9PSED|nr:MULTISPECIES: phage tail assembly chaperone [unclassified Pseudomonas]MEE1869083.1 phage tail assembly chaperone [Pseudomonas sp. 120P]MEE1959730.1 phage tail assembly chaperone [Pseudomonas sp. 119P]